MRFPTHHQHSLPYCPPLSPLPSPPPPAPRAYRECNGPSAPGVLWQVSGHLVAFMFLYALLGTAATTALFGAPLMALHYRLLCCEANLRFR